MSYKLYRTLREMPRYTRKPSAQITGQRPAPIGKRLLGEVRAIGRLVRSLFRGGA